MAKKVRFHLPMPCESTTESDRDREPEPSTKWAFPSHIEGIEIDRSIVWYLAMAGASGPTVNRPMEGSISASVGGQIAL